jgi:hypothetical protein
MGKKGQEKLGKWWERKQKGAPSQKPPEQLASLSLLKVGGAHRGCTEELVQKIVTFLKFLWQDNTIALDIIPPYNPALHLYQPEDVVLARKAPGVRFVLLEWYLNIVPSSGEDN